ncbi:MAG: hypothetical protein Q8R76_09495 [Candidatus Omnitrophota bacterium]|nr:hypothetical protein [Candidatus Omnitrophota bacterium]
MKKFTRMLVVLVAIAVLPAVAFAGSPWTMESSYGDKAMGKLEFGIKNALGGWTEILTEPKATLDADENVLVGIGQGIWNAAFYTVGGLLHIVTFPITSLDVPLPQNGVDF